MTVAGFDGCMVDRWTRLPKVKNVSAARMAAWSQGRDNATSALIAEVARLKKTGVSAFLLSCGEGDLRTDAITSPGFGYKLGTGRASDGLEMLMRSSAAGKGFFAAAKVGSVNKPQDRIGQISAFLIGASTNSFFGAGAWQVSHTRREVGVLSACAVKD